MRHAAALRPPYRQSPASFLFCRNLPSRHRATHFAPVLYPLRRYSAPYTPYGFTVVTRRPQLAAVAYTDVMWAVFSAFTPSCWGVIVASVRARACARGRWGDSTLCCAAVFLGGPFAAG